MMKMASSRRRKKQQTGRISTLVRDYFAARHAKNTNQNSDSLHAKLQLSMLNSGLISLADQQKYMAALPKRAIEHSAFVAAVQQRRKYPVLWRAEWQVINKAETHSTRHATKSTNEHKNQNKKIVSYDYNRVVLDPIPGVIDSDYVNASYVDSLLKPNAYLVSQGPNEKTVADFWRLIWQKNIYLIIMLTKTFDFIKICCNQYWPTKSMRIGRYADFEVVVLSQESLANFVIRKFKVKKGDEEEREITQYHYCEWPCHTVPYPNAMLDFRRRIRQYISKNNVEGPLFVHCSDGGGRTGTFLAIDANLELGEEDGVYDVFGYVKKLRTMRKGLVDTMEQYRFIYSVLEENLTCGNSWFNVSEISQRLKFKSMKQGITRTNEYQKEYRMIRKSSKMTAKFTIGDCAGGHRPENRLKQRDITIVPPDNFRPYLTSFQGNDCTDYLNSVFVDGYNAPREYIVTEWPLPRTIPDFWSLVYDHDCNSAVILGNPESADEYPLFWPENSKSKKYGNIFTIEYVSNMDYPNIKTWIFRIQKKVVSLTELMAGIKAEAKTIQIFQLTCWPMGHRVPTSTNALVEMMNMVERWRQRTTYGQVVVLSHNGKSRVGVYCAASAAIEQVTQHQEVDVFQAAKTVRRHRPQLVENMTEYKYCYDLVLHYVVHYLNKEG